MTADYRDRVGREAADDDARAARVSAPGAASTGDVERRSEIVTEAQHGERLDKVLVAIAPEFSRNYLQSLVEEARVQLDAG